MTTGTLRKQSRKSSKAEKEMDTSRVVEVRHPLIQNNLAKLRDKATGPEEFRHLVRCLASLLAYEATKDLALEPIKVETPITTADGHRLKQRIGIVPILRAGLGMVDAVLDLIPSAEVWHLGIYRDERTAEPIEYYSKLPSQRPVDVALVLDPMLATGGSASAALSALQAWGVPKTKLLVIIAAEDGIKAVTAESPDTQIYACQVDPELNSKKYIVPGLGDAGDRIFNTPDNH